MFAAGFLAHFQGDDEHAVALLEQRLALYRDLGDPRGTALAPMVLGIAADDQGAYDRARDLLAEAVTLCRDLGDRQHLAYGLIRLGVVA